LDHAVLRCPYVHRKHICEEMFPIALCRGTLRWDLMKTEPLKTWTAYELALFVLAAVIAAPLAAQSPGSIEFTALVTPSGGRPEPVRQMTFYALRKDLADIRQEALRIHPAPDLDSFVDGLSFSAELKTWMKTNRTVQLAGPEFTRSLKPGDIVDVPEFYDAYMARNAAFEGVGFPKPKFREKDRTANPEKYKLQREEFREALRKFVAATPDSVQGIDADLIAINPHEKWMRILKEQAGVVEKLSLEMAQRQYLAAQAETNLEGRGSFAGLAPGDYWISMLDVPAAAGDVRLHWDLRVTVRPGETYHVDLTNFNATESDEAMPHPNP
jgi:hypothetical protein